MQNILLRDNKNKFFQKMLFLRNETEMPITENVIKINKTGHQLNINDINIDTSTEELEKQGYKNDEALYDKLIIEYNQNNKDLLTRWK
jgi:hypothetical protein